MQKIDDFDWDYLYAKAEEYIKEFIPEAHVNHGTMTLHGANPIVDVSFPEKGNKKVIKYLYLERCMEHHQKTIMKKNEFRYSCSAEQRNGIEKNSDEVPKLD